MWDSILSIDYYKLLWLIIDIIIIVVPLLLCVAYLTYWERKIIAAMQLRRGPNVTGPFGLLQPLADGVKLMLKEIIVPDKSDKVMFIIAPMITFILSIVAWAVIPFNANGGLANINVGILYLLGISSLGVYGVIISGWASNSKYAFLGSIRSAAQMISYEVSIGLIIVCVLLTSGSLNLSDIVLSHQTRPLYIELLLIPMGVIFFISSLAETNRLPFDLPEAESELVAGFNVEYSSMPFAMFFLGEYANMILMSGMTTILFLGGWLPPFNISFLDFIPGFIWFSIKISFVLFCFIWVRGTFPRYRYDQLMSLGWKMFLPITLLWVILIASLLFCMGDLPMLNV